MSASSSQQQPYVNNINNSSSGGGHNNQHPDYEELVDAAGHNHHQDNRRQPLYEDGGMMMLEDNGDDSEEDTEEASETEMGSSSNHRNADEPIEIKEQMYQDKLATLKKQLEELRSGTHPEYVRRVKKLEHQYNERIRLNEIYREYLISCVERDYILEKNAAVKEYEEKKIDLRENLMTDFEDRRKMIENERSTMELTGDSVDVKPTITRKLRRRPNEPLPVPEKRRKPTTGQLVLLLDEKEVENDLKLISRGKAAQTIRNQHAAAAAAASSNGAASSSAQQNNHASPLVNNSSNSASHQVNNYSQQLNNSSSATTSTSIEVNLSGLTAPSAPGPQAPQPSASQTNSVVNSSAGTAGQPSTPAPNNVASQSHHPQQPQSQPQSNNPTPSIPQAPNNVPPAPTPTQNPSQSSQQQPPQQPQPQQQQQQQQPLVETRIEDGKLLYERRWFHRGQPVYVEGKDIARFSANISAIGSEAIWVKKTSDGQKVRIFTNQLSRGKVSIKRRAN